MNVTEQAKIFYQCRDDEDFYLDKCEHCEYLKFDDLDYFNPYCDYGKKCETTDMRGDTE